MLDDGWHVLDDGRHVHDFLLRHGSGLLHGDLNLLLLDALLRDDDRHVHDLLMRHGDGCLHRDLNMLLLDALISTGPPYRTAASSTRFS